MVLRQLFQVFRQVIEWDAQISGDVFLIALVRRANVNGQRRLYLYLGSVRQARQIELLENHCAATSLADYYFGWGTIRR
jgi:hypothetical protein